VSGFYPDWDPQRCEHLLARLGLRRNDRIDALSFGGRVKLSLLLALSRNAQVLLLDEPSIGLDPLARQVLFAELLRFMQSEARTIVISSHQLTELERFADHVAVMNQGQIVVSGATPDLLERYVELDVLLRQERAPDFAGVHLLAAWTLWAGSFCALGGVTLLPWFPLYFTIVAALFFLAGYRALLAVIRSPAEAGDHDSALQS
jgi:ABC-type multidrug transport system ATPase subunit